MSVFVSGLLFFAAFASVCAGVIGFIKPSIFHTNPQKPPPSRIRLLLTGFGWAFVFLLVVGILGYGDEPPAKAETSTAAQSDTTPKPKVDTEPQSNESQSAIPTPAQNKFDWIILPGLFANLKEMGFSDCTADHYGYTCKSTEKSILSVPVSSMEINLKPYGNIPYSERPTSKIISGFNSKEENDFLTKDARDFDLSLIGYDQVSLRFDDDKIDEKCYARFQKEWKEQHQEEYKEHPFGKPKECITKKGNDFFLQTLKETGWVASTGRDDYFVHDGVEYMISKERNVPKMYYVQFAKISEINDKLNYIKDITNKISATEQKAKSAIDSLK